MGPRTIVQGRKKIDMRKDMVVFGAYSMLYVKTNNYLILRIVPGIFLIESNDHGVQYFMSLYICNRINGYRGSAFPIVDEVIGRVEELSDT